MLFFHAVRYTFTARKSLVDDATKNSFVSSSSSVSLPALSPSASLCSSLCKATDDVDDDGCNSFLLDGSDCYLRVTDAAEAETIEQGSPAGDNEIYVVHKLEIYDDE